MKTKFIPFDLEIANKIQAGEIDGKIKTIHGCKARIICWDRKDSETPIVFLAQYDDWEDLYECNIKGEYMTGRGDDAMLSHLVLEVPDNEPQFKPFDKVLVRHSVNGKNAIWEPQFYSMTSIDPLSNKPIYKMIDGYVYDQVIPYEGNEHLVGTTNKPKED
jgi:hypothetical protein